MSGRHPQDAASSDADFTEQVDESAERRSERGVFGFEPYGEGFEARGVGPCGVGRYILRCQGTLDVAHDLRQHLTRARIDRAGLIQPLVDPGEQDLQAFAIGGELAHWEFRQRLCVDSKRERATQHMLRQVRLLAAHAVVDEL